jgi:hypothetical protein
MRLDRYSGDVGGKFSIIENHNDGRVVHIGDATDDFFVLKFKDRHTAATLRFYAELAEKDGDHELAADVNRLAAEVAMYPLGVKLPTNRETIL